MFLRTYIKKKSLVASDPTLNITPNSRNINYTKVYKDTEDICYNNRNLIKRRKKYMKETDELFF